MCDTTTGGQAKLQPGRNIDGIGALVILAATAPNLTTLRVSNAALKSDTLPARIKILQWGANDTTKGKFHVTPKTVAMLADNQRRLGFERVALDYNHCSVAGTSSSQELLKAGRPPLIFGYGRPSAILDDGVWLEDMEWTPLGVECAKQFEDLSPAVSDEMGCVTFVHSVALTPNGCTHGLTFFSAIAGRAKPLNGRDRMVAAFGREPAAAGLARLSAATAGSEASTAPSRNDNPEAIDTAPALSADDLAKIAYGQMQEDIVGPAIRADLRRVVSRQVNERWIADEKAGRHNHSAAEQQQFREAIDSGTEAAVKAYARLRLGNPVDLQAAIAGSRANPVNG